MDTIQHPGLNTSLLITWDILKFISNHEDKKRMRQVCRTWRTIIDEIIGLELYLDRKNKAKIFSSLILSNCSSLTIYNSGGMARWYICPFSSTKLHKIVVDGEILVDNWVLMMTKCQMLDVLVIHLKKAATKTMKQITIAKWNSWSQPQQLQISVPWLTRLFLRRMIKNLSNHQNAIINMLKSISTPHLKQLMITHNGRWFEGEQDLSDFKQLIKEMKQKYHRFKSFSFLYEVEASCFVNMDLWNQWYTSREDVLLIDESYSDWREISQMFHEDDNLVHLLYGFSSYHHGDFVHLANCIENAGRNSKNITSLTLEVNWRDPTPGLNCAALQSLRNLKFLSLTRPLKDILQWRYTSVCILDNLMLPPSLQVISFDAVLASTLNITTILECPKIKEVSFQNQRWNSVPAWNVHIAFTRNHLVSALNHPTLKNVVFDEQMKPIITLFSNTLHHNLKNKWSYLDQKSSPKEIIIHFGTAGDGPVEHRVPVKNTRVIHVVPKAFVLVVSSNTTEVELRDLEKRFK